jgi:pyruvate kinase
LKCLIALKIETLEGVDKLPGLIVQAAGRQPTAVMTARGDLAVEIGYRRLAEIQEEILWLCEAASIPVIWATQVLDEFVKTGMPGGRATQKWGLDGGIVSGHGFSRAETRRR